MLSRALPSLKTSDAMVDRFAYARDLWPRRNLDLRDGNGLSETTPALVAWPTTTEEVASLVRFCAQEQIPVVPFGAGSGVCGAVHPDQRTLIIDLKKMARWRSLDESKPELDIEPGAMGITLEQVLQSKGWTIGHFPSSILCSTAGGWVAGRGAGQCSGRYGKIEDMVAGLEFVDGRGEVHQVRRRINGPDLIPLLVGSEGTLGVITSCALRLHQNPTVRVFTAFSFPSLEAGWNAMKALFQAGLRPAVSRLYDPFDSFIAKSGSAKKKEHIPGVGGSEAGRKVVLKILEHPGLLNKAVEFAGDVVLGWSTLVLIYEGTGEDVREDAERGEKICLSLGAKPMGDGPARKWMQHRYSVSYRMSPIFVDGGFCDTFEVAAPWSKLRALYDGVRHALGKHLFVMAHLSHCYPDGCCIYFTFAGNAQNDQQAREKYDRAWRDAMTAAVEAGGTLSHHHGSGRSKGARMSLELGSEGLWTMRSVMKAFDPAGILNPGNLLPKNEDNIPRTTSLSTISEMQFDADSQLATVPAATTLGQLKTRLAEQGLRAALPDDQNDKTVSDWLAQGAPGPFDPWADPVDHLIAGLEVTLPNGTNLLLRPEPRRASGPDLMSLFVGTQGRLGKLHTVSLRTYASHSPAARVLPYQGERNPAQTTGEKQLWEHIENELVSEK